MPSLDVTPKALWTLKAGTLVATGDRVALSRGSLAVTAAGSVSIVDTATRSQFVWGGQTSELFRSVVADDLGHFFVSGKSAYAIGSKGELLWRTVYPGGRPIMDEWSQCDVAHSRASGILVAACNDGYLYGVQSGTIGKLIWQKRVYSSGLFDLFVPPGVGKTVIMGFGRYHAQPRLQWYASESGAEIARVLPAGYFFNAVSTRGYLASHPTLSLLDACGRPVWQHERTKAIERPVVTGIPGERVMAYEGIPGATNQLSMFSLADGKRIAGPIGQGTPVAAGADGAFYALTCNALKGESLRTRSYLVAYDPDLAELWRVEMPIPQYLGAYYPCPKPGVALDRNGVMYLAVEADGTYIIAIQTRSPGLAPTPWPTQFGGNSGGNWVD